MPAVLVYVPFGQLSGAAATVVLTAAVAVVAVTRASVVAVVATVVAGARVVVVVASVVLVVVEVLVVVLLVLLVVELEVDVDEVAAGSSVATGVGDVGCSAKGALTNPRANRLPRTPSGTCPHIGRPRKAAQNLWSIAANR